MQNLSHICRAKNYFLHKEKSPKAPSKDENTTLGKELEKKLQLEAQGKTQKELCLMGLNSNCI
jgi:hypothetical protein